MSGPIVKLLDGLVRGKACSTENDKSYYNFTVPYAEPPVGKRKFREAVPIGKWDGIMDCTNDEQQYIQYSSRNQQCEGTEVLTMNVCTPKLPDELSKPMPVMVYLHGGGFDKGTSSSKAVRPNYFLEQGIVYVGIQSRLSIYGYLCLNTPEVPGNNGLKDQTLAMRWIKNNISAFGGDPNSVCIYGVSSGAAQVEMHMVSPLSRGLFHKAVAVGGCSIAHWVLSEEPIELAFKVGKMLGYDGTDKTELLQIFEDCSAEDLTTAVQKVGPSAEAKKVAFKLFFTPVVEKAFDGVDCFLGADPFDSLNSGRLTKVPYMIWISDREGGHMSATLPEKLNEIVSSGDLFAYLPYEIRREKGEEIESRIKELYNNEETFTDSVIDFCGDADFAAPVLITAKLVAKYNPDVYLSCFGYDGNFSYKKRTQTIARGATHCDPHAYLLSKISPDENTIPTDYLVRDRMRRILVDFVKTGNPTPERSQLIDTLWETLDHKRMNYLDITENLRMEENLLGKRRRLWEDIFLKHEKTEKIV